MECKRYKWNCKERGGSGCFQKKKFELIALMETKLKGNGEVSWCVVNDIIAGVQEMKELGKGWSYY